MSVNVSLIIAGRTLDVKPTYDNAIQALCTHYNAGRVYDTVFAPVFNHRRQLLIAATGIVVSYAATKAAVKAYRRHNNRKKVATRIHSARMRRRREFETVKSQLLNDHSTINEQDINDMIDADGPYAVFEAVRSHRFSLHDVVQVYQKRCILAQDLCNPITHMFVEAAGDAENLQARVKKTGVMPPLYGLVFSVKEMYGVAGTDSTLGISRYLEHLAHEDSVIVAAMRKMGAILLCKTNFPQTLFSFASSNPIYGVTINPHDLSRSPGGSSSGEGALLALNGTMLGWGSDIGGSVRIPAHFCGISSFKPINDRFCGRGVREVLSSAKSVLSTYGMMSRDMRLIALVHKTLLRYSDDNAIFALDVEKRAPPIAWRDGLYNESQSKKLRIGYFIDDGYFPSTPGVQRAVQYAINLLRERGGHTLIPFDLPADVWDTNDVLYQLLLGDRMRDVYENLCNDEIDPNIQGLYDMARTIYKGNWISRQVLLLHAALISRRWFCIDKAVCKIRKPEDFSEAVRARDAYRSKFLGECKKLSLDVLLCPVTATPALKLGDEAQTESTLSYTARVNFLNLPAGVVTVTTENADDQKALEANYSDTDFEERLVKQSVRGAVGLPLGVQIIGCNPYREEVCLKVLTGLQQYCKEFVTFPAKVSMVKKV